MDDNPAPRAPARATFAAAFRFSVPVLMGYSAIGIAFGLLLSDAGYPPWLAVVMSVFVFAGAAQFTAVGLFAAGAGLVECALVTLAVNARHMAYGFSLAKGIRGAGRYAPYLVFALSDETFALLSSLPEEPVDASSGAPHDRGLLMFFVAALDQLYWVVGSTIGAWAGAVLPWKLSGLDFALTALFIVLVLDQFQRIRRLGPFAVSAVAAVAFTVFLGSRGGLLAAMGASLAVVGLIDAFFGAAGRERRGKRC